MKSLIISLFLIVALSAENYFKLKQPSFNTTFANITYINKTNERICLDDTHKIVIINTKCNELRPFHCLKNDNITVCAYKNLDNNLIVFNLNNVGNNKTINRFDNNLVDEYNNFLMSLYVFYNTFMMRSYAMKKVIIKILLHMMRHDEYAFGKIFNKDVKTIFHTHEMFSLIPIEFHHDPFMYKNITIDKIKNIDLYEIKNYKKQRFDKLKFTNRTIFDNKKIDDMNIIVSNYLKYVNNYDENNKILDHNHKIFNIFFILVSIIIFIYLCFYICKKFIF